MIEIPLEFVAFIAIALGIIGRTYFPYLRKGEEANKAVDSVALKFDAKYYLTAIFTGIITAIFIYPMFVFPEDASLMTVFITGFIFAWGANDVVNRLSH
jgi:NADH:ubiquinone oxidoreductase subunit 3 (subunit A)